MKYIKFFANFFLAGIVAFVILCTVATVYSLSPMRVENEYKNTDYAWEENGPWIKMTEGLSCGFTDEKGFNNLKFIDNPDVLLLGSSHIEGMNVQQKDHVASLMNDSFDGEMTFYNMGISGHTLFKVTQYLEQSVTAFDKVPQYIVIETSTTVLSSQDVYNALTGNVEVTTVNNKGLVAQLQRFPFLRQVYHQLDSGMLDMLLPKPTIFDSKSNTSDSNNKIQKMEIDEKPYEAFFEYLRYVEEQYSTQIIVLYHPFEQLNKDGSISFQYADYTKVFSDYSNKYGIGFVDMTDEFEAMYYNEHKVAHGFVTGELGVGHINKYGHKAMAQSLYDYLDGIKEGE